MKFRVIVLVVMLSTWASAGIVIGTANSGNCIPWSCQDEYPGNYEQIYFSTAFAGPMSINDIQFFNTVYNDGPNQGLAQISGLIYFAVTIQTVPDGSIPSGAVLFSSGTLSGQNWPFGKTLDMSGTPFYYDPSMGNLELIVVPTTILGGPLSGVYTLFDAGDSNPFSRWCPACGGNYGYGLVTGFNTGGPSTPEPGSLALMGSGVIGLAATLRRKLMK